MKISQSLLKDITGQYCPYFIKMKYIDGIETEPTPAMENGLYFESQLLGSSRGGKFELPLLKNGKPSKRQTDIDEVVKYAKYVFEAVGVAISDVQIKMDNGILTGTIDALAQNKAGNRIIIDVKYTGLSFEQYQKEIMWSALGSSYRLQGRHYQLLEGNKLPSFFFVFSSKGWCRIFQLEYNEQAIDEHYERCLAAVEELNDMDMEQTIDDANACNVCGLKDLCNKRKVVPEVEDLTLL